VELHRFIRLAGFGNARTMIGYNAGSLQSLTLGGARRASNGRRAATNAKAANRAGALCWSDADFRLRR
jgi:hypothetical protein